MFPLLLFGCYRLAFPVVVAAAAAVAAAAVGCFSLFLFLNLSKAELPGVAHAYYDCIGRPVDTYEAREGREGGKEGFKVINR